MNNEEALRLKLLSLEQEHQELNEIIDNPALFTQFTEFTIQKFKKRKLFLKDEINRIKTLLYPDLIA